MRRDSRPCSRRSRRNRLVEPRGGVAAALRGRQLPACLRARHQPARRPRVQGVVVTARDIDARKAFEEQLRHRAFHDPLTGAGEPCALLRPYRARAGARATPQRPRRRALPRHRRLQAGQRPLRPRRRRRAARRGRVAPARLRAQRGHPGAVRRRRVRAAPRIRAGPTSRCKPGSGSSPPSASRSSCAASRTGSPSRSASPSATTATCGVDELLRCADLAMYAAKRNGKRRIELYAKDCRSGPAERPRPARLLVALRPTSSAKRSSPSWSARTH